MSQGDSADPIVGMTGARFGGGSRRKAVVEAAARASVKAITEPFPPVPAAGLGDDKGRPAPGVGQTGARFGSRSSRRRLEPARALNADDPELPDVVGDLDRGGPEFGAAEVEGAGVEEGDSGEIVHISVRPYVLTGGRTWPSVELAIETLVSVAERSPDPVRLLDRHPDHAAVLALCDVPRSVAEIAALMQVALGVARVLVGDLAESGAVIVRSTAGAAGPDLAFLERVLGGLRKL